MTDTSISPLRRRMIEDMTIRGFTAATQRSYLAAVMSFTAFFGRPPDAASAEDLRRYQVHMRSIGTSATGMNAAVSALRFFFGVTLERGDAHAGMTSVRAPKTLPVILSPQEVARLLDAAPGLKYRAALSVAYGAGLRASEVVSLKIADIDSQRMVIRVEQGIRDHQQRITEAAGSHVLEEGTHRFGVLLGARHQMQQHLGAGCREAPGCQHRLALLSGADALGNAVNEQIGDVVLAQIPGRELLVVRP